MHVKKCPGTHETNVPLEQRRLPSPAKTEVEQQMCKQSMSYRLQGIWRRCDIQRIPDRWPFPVCFFQEGYPFRRRIVADDHGRLRDAFRRLFWFRFGLLTILDLEANLGLKNL